MILSISGILSWAALSSGSFIGFLIGVILLIFTVLITYQILFISPLINKSADLIKLGRYDEALKVCDKVLKRNNYFDAWNNKGIALKNLGLYEEALKAYDEAMKKRDKEVIWLNKGFTLDKIGRNDEASECYKRASELKKK